MLKNSVIRRLVPSCLDFQSLTGNQTNGHYMLSKLAGLIKQSKKIQFFGNYYERIDVVYMNAKFDFFNNL